MSLVWTFAAFLLGLKRLFLVILLVHSSDVCGGGPIWVLVDSLVGSQLIINKE